MPTNLQAVPYLDQYFGLWMMHADSFWPQFNLLRNSNLQLHLEARAANQSEPSVRAAPQMVDKIAVVSLHGKLMKQESSMGGGTSTVAVRRQVRALMANDQVSGVILHIDSPGGTVAGTEELAKDIVALAAVKPVHAYLDDLAASAAYWLASQATHISAGDSTLVGSIGTYAVVHDMSGAAAMEGIKAYVVRAGQFKGAGTPGTEVTSEQLAEMQRTVDSLNEQFLQGVASGRKMDRQKVNNLADGRVHIARDAKQLGLIDAVENFDAAVRRLQTTTLNMRSRATMAEIVIPEASVIETMAEQPPVVTPVEKKEPAATFEQLEAGCFGAGADFIVAQLKAKATVAQAQTAWMMAQQAEIAKVKSEAAQAATVKPGVSPVADVSAKAEATDDARLKFNQLVAARVASGESKMKAVANVIAANPDLHAAVIEEANQGRKARK